MEEFQRVYGFAAVGAPLAEESDETFLLRLRDPVTGPAARRELEEGIQQLKLHYAALLEAYQSATHEGARRILESVDPEQLRREFEGGKIRVGPVAVPCRWRPLLTQAIWEEMLARFRGYRLLENADFERFFRDGFRAGYRRFLDGRSQRPAGQNTVDS
jgi:predicted component of type VI protein secretion system